MPKAKGEPSDDAGIPVAKLDPSEHFGSVNLHDLKHDEPTILICGHNDKGRRCGTLGSILLKDFNKQIASAYARRYPAIYAKS